jgi:hypothetical protein
VAEPRSEADWPERDARTVLAGLAAEAAVATPGVARLEPGRTDEGVSAVVEPGGRYEVTVRVVAEPVPMPAMAEALRERVADAARTAGLDGELGSVTVIVGDLADSELPA